MNAGGTIRILCLLCCSGVFITDSEVNAIELEPRAYSNAPVGMNFLLAGYQYSSGALVFDTSLPITDANASVDTGLIGYVRVINIAGKSAKAGMVLPYAHLSADGYVSGVYRERTTTGIADPSFYLSLNLYGAPAFSAGEFGSYQQRTIIGISFKVMPPLGDYEADKIINLGTNRWTLVSEIGISHAIERWRLEAASSAYLYTDNTNFDNGKIRQQSAIYAIQFNVVYSFSNGIWTSVGSTYYTGGETSIDGVDNNDSLDNIRTGLTLALPVNRQNSVKIYSSTGISTRTGTDFDSVGIIWQYRWGG